MKKLKQILRIWLFPNLVGVDECQRLVRLLNAATGSEYTTLDLKVGLYATKSHRPGGEVKASWRAYDEFDHVGRSAEHTTAHAAVTELLEKQSAYKVMQMLQKQLNPETV